MYEFPPKVAPDVPPLHERMTPEKAAEFLGVSEATLRNWRSSGDGPPFFRVGRIFYWKRDVDRWLLSRRVESHETSRVVTHRTGKRSGPVLR